jgi:hypothetical protein
MFLSPLQAFAGEKEGNTFQPGGPLLLSPSLFDAGREKSSFLPFERPFIPTF